MLPFANRAEAGRLLAQKLAEHRSAPDIVVLGLPPGGVPVAFKIAEQLHAPLDILVVRKVGLPWHPEVAMGAVASGGVRILDCAFLRSAHLSNYFAYALIDNAEDELKKREQLLRDGRAPERIARRTVILVDDGAATGSTLLAAAQAVRMQNPREIVVALPVASKEASAPIADIVDEYVCLATPEPFISVARCYRSFPQVLDDEIKDLLSSSRTRMRGSHISRPQSAARAKAATD